MNIVQETWGQPPISIYKVDNDGENLYAMQLRDFYGELACSNYIRDDMVYLTPEDLEDLILFEDTVNDATVKWSDLKEELTRDGIL